MIVKTFPSEIVERYYIAPTRKKDSPYNKSITSKGKLMSLWRNRKYNNKLLFKKISKEITEVNNTSPRGKFV